ncbi:hypothetical protein D3C76_705730 [compost metagenome]
MEKVRRSQQTISYDASLAESARATKTACLKRCTQFAVERNNMPSPSISSSSSVTTSIQTDAPAVAETTSEQYFQPSFYPANGDLVLGQISVASKGNSIWTPGSLQESLLSMFNIMVKQPELFSLEGGQCTKINDRPDSIGDLVGAMYLVLKEEGQRKESRVNNEPVRQPENKTAHNSNADSARRAVDESACVINFRNGFIGAMYELEKSIRDSNDSGGSALTDYCDIFSRNKLDELFSKLKSHSCYISADTPLETASMQKEPVNGNSWQRIHKPAAYLFSIISKGMIDGFIRQQSESEPTARIHFFLDDIQIHDVVDRTGADAFGTTSEELRHLYHCRDQLGGTVVWFYKNNQRVPSPWEQDPELWSRCAIGANVTPAPSAPEQTITTNVPADAKGEMSASVSSLLTDSYYFLFRDFNLGVEYAKHNIGFPEGIGKAYREEKWEGIITQEEYASLLAYRKGFDKHIDPCLGSVDPERKSFNTVVSYIVSALGKLRALGYSNYCDGFRIDKFFAKYPELPIRFLEESYLRSSVVPIKPLPDSPEQRSARPDQVFDFKRNDKNEYEFVRRSNGESCKLSGVFTYVILATEPDHVYCGVGNGQQDSKGELNEYRHRNRDYIEGHSSLAQGKDVLFAGEFLFVDGQLKLWTNGSGHYEPAAALRLTNLTEVVKRILPENLFRDHDELTATEIQALNAYIRISEKDEGILRARYSTPVDSESDSDSGSGSDSDSETDADVFKKLMIKRGLGERVVVRAVGPKNAGAA